MFYTLEEIYNEFKNSIIKGLNDELRVTLNEESKQVIEKILHEQQLNEELNYYEQLKNFGWDINVYLKDEILGNDEFHTEIENHFEEKVKLKEIQITVTDISFFNEQEREEYSGLFFLDFTITTFVELLEGNDSMDIDLQVTESERVVRIK